MGMQPGSKRGAPVDGLFAGPIPAYLGLSVLFSLLALIAAAFIFGDDPGGGPFWGTFLVFVGVGLVTFTILLFSLGRLHARMKRAAKRP